MLKEIVFIIVIGAVKLAQATTACSAQPGQCSTDSCTMAESVKNLADATKNLAKLAMKQEVEGECSSLSSCSCKNNTLIVKELMDEVKNNTILIKKLQEEVKLQRDSCKAKMKQLEKCNLFPHSKSCQEIKEKCPSSKSGYYTLVNHQSPVYCNFDSETCPFGSGWKRVAYLNMSDTTATCPNGFRVYFNHTYKVRACGRKELIPNSCQSVKFNHSMTFSEVCGKVIGYQYWAPDGLNGPSNISLHYVDGISLTYGYPHQHIWTFMATNSEISDRCPCANGSTFTVPSFINNDYFCESGNPSSFTQILYADDPLWDGENCGSKEAPCCKVNNIPWFHKKLPSATTDYIELRICSNWIDEDTPVAFYDIYVK